MFSLIITLSLPLLKEFRLSSKNLGSIESKKENWWINKDIEKKENNSINNV